jgi:hypothetical protein
MSALRGVNAAGEGPAGGEAVAEGGPTQEQRRALVLAYQAEALRRPNPLSANLTMITADLMGLAHRLVESVKEGLGPGPAGLQRLGRHADLYLKVVGQIGRLVQMEQRPPFSPPAGGEKGG